MIKNKPTGIFIIILCVFSVPLAIYGTVLKIKDSKNNTKEGNFYYEGILNFFDKGSLLGNYTCKVQDEEACGYANNTLSDLDNNLIKIPNGTKLNLGMLANGTNKYAFIKDNKVVSLYAINANKVIIEYQEIKFYNSEIADGYLLVKNNNKWGVLSTTSMINIIKPEYDYLGAIDRRDNNGNLLFDILIAKNNNMYQLIDLQNNKLTKEINKQIVDFDENKKIITTYDNTYYQLYDYDLVQGLFTTNFKKILITDNYYVGLTEYNYLQVYNDFLGNPIINENINDDVTTLTATEDDKTLSIYINDNLYKTIEK